MTTLSTLQEWMGKTITQSLQRSHELPEHSQMQAMNYIAPSLTLKPHQRLEIYHQQYWWRLIKAMQDNFPTVFRLFGEGPFQWDLCVPYLSVYPPEHWAIFRLGEKFPEWLSTHYHAEDRTLVLTCAAIDAAVGHAYWCAQRPVVNFEHMSQKEILNQKLFLQPFIHLFELSADFFSFRENLLKNPSEHYNANAFPQMSYGKQYFVLYRTPTNVIAWRHISRSEFWMLSQFKKGSTINQACEKLEIMRGTLLEEALATIPLWFKQWTVLEWFGLSSSSF